MSEELLDKVRDAVDGVIVCTPCCLVSESNPPSFQPSHSYMLTANICASQDFDGQRRAEVFATLLLALSGVRYAFIQPHVRDNPC